MKKILFMSLTILSTLFISCASTSGSVKKDRTLDLEGLKSKVEELIKNTDPNVNIGIQISSLTDGKVLLEKNPQRLFPPSSTMKVITVAAALHYLGPFYRFTTTVFAEGLDQEGTHVKSLYIKGSGDPSLMDTDLARLASEIKQMGIKQIGNIYVDDKIFDDVSYNRGTMGDDRSYGFAAPVRGLGMNYNCLLLKTVPAHRAAKNAHVLLSPSTNYIKTISRVKTKSDKSGRNITILVKRGQGREEAWPGSNPEGLGAGDTIIIDGHVQKDSEASYTKVAVKDPSLFAGNYFKEQLHHLGVKVKGKVMRGTTAVQAIKLVEHQSRALSEALVDFNKVSLNVPLDSLVKAMSANSKQSPATAQGGLKLINDFLTREVGIPSGALITADGSGLSRYNLISPEQMVKLLSYAAKNFRMAPEFLATLPIAGRDGTLTSRLRGELVQDNIRAKTGTMSGLSSLVGYVGGDNNERYPFAIMISGFIGGAAKYTKLQDDILASMFKGRDTELAKGN